MRISDWSSDVCSSDLADAGLLEGREMGEADLQGRRDAVEVGLQELMAELPRRLALRPGLAGALIGPHQHAAALLAGVDLALGVDGVQHQIGRASCRQSVGQYV